MIDDWVTEGYDMIQAEKDGEATLQTVIREHPCRSYGYVALSSELASPQNPRTDVSRAIALLEQALALPVEDAAEGETRPTSGVEDGRLARRRSHPMKETCPICGKGKARRGCQLLEMADICSRCCAAKREESCSGCPHYAEVQQYQATRRTRTAPSDGHFMIELNPKVEEAVNAALELAQQGGAAQAEETLRRLLREHPANHLVCYGIGALHALKGEHQDAIKWFEKAVAIYPYFVEAHFNRGLAYQKQLDIGNAVRAYRKVVELGDPDEPFVKQARSFLDNAAEAVRSNEGVDLDTYVASQAEFDRAFALMEKGDWAGALAGLRACIAKTEKHAPSHGNMGICLAMLGRKAEALAEFDRALEVNPDYEPAMVNRAAVVGMEEGKPMNLAAFKSIHYGRERLK